MTCKREASRRDRQDPAKRERILAYWRAYKKRKQQDHEWRARRNESAQASRIRREYGLTREQYASMHASQGGVCAICRLPSRYRKADGSLSGRLAVDHDHNTGRIRGLLCDQCNRMIGHLDKDPERAAAAIRYLGLV